jgi:hypothetical protein
LLRLHTSQLLPFHGAEVDLGTYQCLTAQVADVRLDGLPDGTKITYDVVPNKGKESAENLQVQRTNHN